MMLHHYVLKSVSPDFIWCVLVNKCFLICVMWTFFRVVRNIRVDQNNFKEKRRLTGKGLRPGV